MRLNALPKPNLNEEFSLGSSNFQKKFQRISAIDFKTFGNYIGNYSSKTQVMDRH